MLTASRTDSDKIATPASSSSHRGRALPNRARTAPSKVKGLFPSNSSFKSPGPVAAAEFVFERKITKRTKRRGFSNYSSHSSFPLFPLKDFEQKITKKTKVSEFVGPFISLFVFVSFCWKSACTREAIRFSYSLFVSFC